MDRRWPSPSDGQLLRAALLEGDAAGRAWRTWRASHELEAMDLAAMRLAPLLYRNLAAAAIDPADRERLKAHYTYAWSANQRLFRLAADALAALAGAGVETMVLKGAALATLYYPDPGTRPMVDVDVLVRTSDAVAAFDALERSGWRLGLDTRRRRQALAALNSTPLTGEHGERVDLHWRALDEPARDDDFWSAAQPIEVGGVRTLAPGPAEQLLHVCAHGLGEAPAPLRWVADAVIVARRGDPDWQRVLERARARRLASVAAPALRYLRDEFGLTVPEQGLLDLEREVTGMDRLLRRAAWGRRRHGRFAANTWDRYRRLRSGEHDSPVPAGFLSFLADQLGFTSRRSMAAYFGRRAVGRRRSPRGRNRV